MTPVQSSWYCFTLTCTRTTGGGRYFIVPHKPVNLNADVGNLRMRLLLVNEQELREIASGEVGPGPRGFFNSRHEGRWKILSRFADMFLQQLAHVTGQTEAVAC